MARHTIITCDVCSSEQSVRAHAIQVIFNTEQTEGRSCKPYLFLQDMEICDGCVEKIINSGRYLQAYGCMGHNTYGLPKEGA